MTPGFTDAMDPAALLARRLDRLPRISVLGTNVAVAESPVARLLGLALIDRGCAGAGLWIPRCRSVHTFGMRFRLDLVFLDPGGQVIRQVGGVPPRRVVRCREAFGVLELPSGAGA